MGNSNHWPISIELNYIKKDQTPASKKVRKLWENIGKEPEIMLGFLNAGKIIVLRAMWHYVAKTLKMMHARYKDFSEDSSDEVSCL